MATLGTIGTGVHPPSGSGEHELAAGEAVGEYVVEAAIGKGGFGTVYRAVHPLIGKHVAIKVLARRFSADDGMVSRFVAEARAVNQIRHRHIIDIFSFGQLQDGRHYYVMEHLDGAPLDHYLAERGALRVDEAMPILRAIARALDAAHAKGIAHRDLKPENIFLAHDGDGGVFPKLLDFGIAKLSGPEDQYAHKTGTGVPIGTPYYMSPEQCRGRDVDHRTDIYSFGVLTYRLLTGAYPFTGELIEILHKQMHEEPVPPSQVNPTLGADVDRAIAAMMNKDAAQRPPSVTAAVMALADMPVSTPMLTPSITGLKGVASASSKAVSGLDATLAVPDAAAVSQPSPQLPARRRWMLPLIAGVLAVGVAAFVVVRQLQAGDPEQAASPVAAPAVTPDAGTAASAPDASVASEPPVIDAGAVAATVDAAVVPEFVTIDVTGVPAGTIVKFAGEVIATAPGPVQLPHGTKEIALLFTATGYNPKTYRVTPDRDQPLAVALARKSTHKVPRAPDKDDLARPNFGGGN